MGAAFYDSWDGGRYPADLISGSQIQLVNKGNLDVPRGLPRASGYLLAYRGRVLLLDACHSGAVGAPVAGRPTPRPRSYRTRWAWKTSPC